MNYWELRALNRSTVAEAYTEAELKRIYKIYAEAGKDIQRMIENIYDNYAKTAGLDKQTLKELMSYSDTAKFWKTMQGKNLEQYVMRNYKARISRLEKIKGDLYIKAKDLAVKENLVSSEMYKNLLQSGYQQTVSDVFTKFNMNSPFAVLDNRTINDALRYRWSGKNYSERIWGNTDILADRLGEILTRGVMTGAGVEKMSREIREQFNVSKFYADRLARTESNHFHNEAEYMAYQDMGIEEYVFLAVLDKRTSQVCEEHNEVRFKMSEKETGVNWPPLHPNCRSTVMAWIGEEYMPSFRTRGDGQVQAMVYTEKTNSYQVNNIATNQSDNNSITKYKFDETKDKLVADKNGIKVDSENLKGIDKELLEKNYNQLVKNIENEPLLKDYLKDKEVILTADDLPQNVMATTLEASDGSGYVIILNNSYFNNSEYLKNVMLEMRITTQFMPFADGQELVYVMNHETGHMLEKANQKWYNNNEEISQIAKNIYRAGIYDLSLRGEHLGEFFAECYANTVSGKPNAYGKAFRDYLERIK